MGAISSRPRNSRAESRRIDDVDGSAAFGIVHKVYKIDLPESELTELMGAGAALDATPLAATRPPQRL